MTSTLPPPDVIIAGHQPEATVDMQTPGPLLATGRAVGRRRATGVARFISSVDELEDLLPGEVLLADCVSRDWRPALERAAAVVTNRGGRNCEAAAMARELGIPAVVGTDGGASRLWSGASLIVSCVEGEVGRVYEVTARSRSVG